MELSRRLQAVADLVTAGYKAADIGTDHAYIPIFLVKNGRIPCAIAADVNEGPLERARMHVKENGLEDRIELRISDGFVSFKPGETESAVIAGMGGSLMMRILSEGAEVVRSLKECILQPQSEIEKVRTFLLEEGFLFIEENMVEEDGKFYPMMKVRPPKSSVAGGKGPEHKEAGPWNETELRYGRLLLESRNQVLRRFLEREIRIKKEILSSIEERDSDRVLLRKEQLMKELEYAEKGMEYYVMQRDYAGD